MKIAGGKINRRQLLTKAGTLASAMAISRAFWGSTPNSGGYAPRLSVESYIWSQHFASQKQTLAAGEEEALRSTSQAGYTRIELADNFFTPDVREQTRALLAKFNLSPESVYANTTLHEDAAAQKSIASVLELAPFLKNLGTRVIVTNPLPKPNQGRKTDEELKTQARYVDELGTAVHRQGMRLLLHHHTPELRDNAREWWYELANTDPNVVGCCVDVHWALRGGQDVMPFIRRVGTRVEDIHLRNSQHGVWMEDYGPGDFDYAPVAEYLHQINYRGLLVVELAYEKGTEITRPLEEDLRRSRLYTEKVFGLQSS